MLTSCCRRFYDMEAAKWYYNAYKLREQGMGTESAVWVIGHLQTEWEGEGSLWGVI